MTDSIDLDEMDVESEEVSSANRGDWLWRGEGDPDDEPDDGWFDRGGDAAAVDHDTGTGDDADADLDADLDAETRDSDPLPGVPRENADRPVGIPIESGGAGGAPAAERGGEADPAESGPDAESGPNSAAESGVDPDSGPDAAPGREGSAASGPHGGGVDDMTMALSFAAARRLDDPRFAVVDARAWTDWIGIVGDVPAHRINAFQREHGIDADFFSGAGQGPADRLADIDEHSMFYAERMVLVGVDGEQPIAEAADWEFVRVEDAAEKADWELSDGA
ncbi:hypothetical protein NGM10_09150 [Halorussus salilacus]|uniref:DUF7124 domain-containing protein n=1 Tax=Halorussus salilacus TaxID=2953750 RepID=UPI00209E29EC|nr:hypothetical protein [Halorussus salilacus]USZ66897.1 hypothetical protein NGM10_09150 [Halorussus salilacus]